MRAASMQRMGRRRLPPAKTLWRMARWMEWGNVSGEDRSRSRAASVSVTPEASRDRTGESIRFDNKRHGAEPGASRPALLRPIRAMLVEAALRPFRRADLADIATFLAGFARFQDRSFSRDG